MSEPPTMFQTLSRAIWAFNNEMRRDGISNSWGLTVVLDPPAFQALRHSVDPVMGPDVMANGAVRLMDAVILPKRLESKP